MPGDRAVPRQHICLFRLEGQVRLGMRDAGFHDSLLSCKIALRVKDSDAAARVVVTGHNPNMRHMSHTQRMDVSALNERYHAEDFLFVTCPSQLEASDILSNARS